MPEPDISKTREGCRDRMRKWRAKQRILNPPPPPLTPEQRAELRMQKLGSFEQQQQKAIEALLANRKIAENGCWLWTGSYRGPNKYGQVTAFGKQMTAHRASWMAFKGPIKNGLWVLHKCDTPRCFGPDCLFLGSPQDNVDDMFAKGRNPDRKGENCGTSKLSNEQVLEIVGLLASGVKGAHIAAMFYVEKSTIYGIAKGECWTHITGIPPLRDNANAI